MVYETGDHEADRGRDMGLQDDFRRAKPPPVNTLYLGDCIDVMGRMPSGSIDFILTDPPYLARYTDRSGRSIRNDDQNAWLKPAYAQMFRVLKRDAFAVSFYGWPKVDRFFEAWKAAGFRVGGHIVFRKSYASKSAFLQYRHEQAYLLIKGRPACPISPPPDVLDMPYTGNRLHPTQKPVAALKPLIAAFSQPGDMVMDPFAGSASTLIAARELGRKYVGFELDAQHHHTATRRLRQEAGATVSERHGTHMKI